MKITFEKTTIKIIRDKDNICFPELEREGYKEGQIVIAERQFINGHPTKSFFFDDCVAYENFTAEVISETEKQQLVTQIN